MRPLFLMSAVVIGLLIGAVLAQPAPASPPVAAAAR